MSLIKFEDVLPRLQQLSPGLKTFLSLINELTLTIEKDYISQRRIIVEMVYVYLLSQIEVKLECIKCLLNNTKDDSGLYKIKLFFWTLCKLLKNCSAVFREHKKLLTALIDLRFIKLIHRFKTADILGTSWEETKALRIDLSSILPFYNFHYIDKVGLTIKNGKWIETTKHNLPAQSQSNFIKLSTEQFTVIKLIEKSLKIAKRTIIPVLNPATNPPLKDRIKKLRQKIRERNPSVQNILEAVREKCPLLLNPAENSPTTEELILDNDWFCDNSMCYDPASEEQNHEEGDTQIVPKISPLDCNIEDFLNKCKEESVRIEKDKLKVKFNGVQTKLRYETSSKYVPTDNRKRIGEDCIILEQVSHEEIKAKKQRAQEIRTAKTNGLFSSAASTSKNSQVGISTDKKSSSSWDSSILPSKDCIKTNLLNEATFDGDNEGIKQAKGKVMEEIKRKLQKTQSFSNSITKVMGNKREIILPVDYDLEEYVDLIISPSFISQSFKWYKGKCVIYVTQEMRKV